MGPALGGAGQPHTRADESVEFVRRVAEGDSSIRRPEIQRVALALEHPVQRWLPVGRHDGEIADQELTPGGGNTTHGDLQSRDPSQRGTLGTGEGAAATAGREEPYLRDRCVADDGDRAPELEVVALRR